MKLKNIVLTIFASSLIAGAILYGCTRKKEEFIGAEYLSAPDGFSASNLTASNSVDFTTENVLLTADFSDRVTYTVTYRGLISGALKAFTSVGDKIDANSIGYSWNGGHDGVSFFRSGEQVEVVVSFLRSTYTISDTLTITTKRNFFANTNYIPATLGEANGFEVAATFPAQNSFNSCSCLEGPIATRNLILGAPEGIACFEINGKSTAPNGFFVGGLQHRRAGFFFPDWTDPNQIYFNLYVYGSGKANGRLSLEFHEADLSNDATKPKGECKPPNTLGPTLIGKNQHDGCTDDAWVIQVPFDHVGWKLISVKYADMAPSVALAYGGSGNRIQEPTRVHRVQVTVLSAPTPGEEVAAYFDFPVLSYGAPFDPSK